MSSAELRAGTCVVCSFPRTGEHEPWCPHFMRGPDPGGDPADWPTLLDLLPKEEPCPQP